MQSIGLMVIVGAAAAAALAGAVCRIRRWALKQLHEADLSLDQAARAVWLARKTDAQIRAHGCSDDRRTVELIHLVLERDGAVATADAAISRSRRIVAGLRGHEGGVDGA